ncbi:hypothetical protein IP84_16330 [beta proteobacterium AAP99]|nr:hypothetical protein IP84_16330 [beta proteobacterium AAP99]
MKTLWQRVVAVLGGFVGVPFLGMLPPLLTLWFEAGDPVVVARAKFNLEATLVVCAAQLVAALCLLLPARAKLIERLFSCMVAGVVASLVGVAAAYLHFPSVADPTRLVVIMFVLGISSAAVTFTINFRFTPEAKRLASDPLSPIGLATSREYILLGSSQDLRFIVVNRFYRWIGWLGVAFFGGMAVVAPADAKLWQSVVLLVFAVGSLWMVAWTGKLVITRTSIRHENFFGRYEIRWADVRLVEFAVSSQAGVMVLSGDQRRLCVFAPSFWSGPDAADARRLVAEIFRAQALEPVFSKRAAWLTNKGVRLRS